MELGDATSQVNELNDTGSTLDEAQEATENLIDKSKPADQTNGHDGSPASKVSEKMEDTKAENSLKETPNGDRPSQRVQQGRNYNDRPRKQHGNQADRPYKRNNKSDLTSQPESSDPVAIRKQVSAFWSLKNL